VVEDEDHLQYLGKQDPFYPGVAVVSPLILKALRAGSRHDCLVSKCQLCSVVLCFVSTVTDAAEYSRLSRK